MDKLTHMVNGCGAVCLVHTITRTIYSRFEVIGIDSREAQNHLKSLWSSVKKKQCCQIVTTRSEIFTHPSLYIPHIPYSNSCLAACKTDFHDLV